MPIFDHDGTTMYEIGRVADHNGTEQYTIDKVYDHDGTTMYLIFNRVPEYLYQNGDQVTSETGGWVSVTTGGFWYWGNEWNTGNTKTTPVFNDTNIELATGGSYYMGTIRTSKAIDCSGIKKLTFNFDITKYPGSYTNCYQSVNCAIMSNTNTAPTIVASNTWRMDSSGTGKSIELDTTNYNGSYYIYFGISSGAGYTSRIQLKSILVTE